MAFLQLIPAEGTPARLSSATDNLPTSVKKMEYSLQDVSSQQPAVDTSNTKFLRLTPDDKIDAKIEVAGHDSDGGDKTVASEK